MRIGRVKKATILTKIDAFFFSKCISDCWEPLVNCKNFYDFCNLIAFMKEQIFRGLFSAILEVAFSSIGFYM